MSSLSERLELVTGGGWRGWRADSGEEETITVEGGGVGRDGAMGEEGAGEEPIERGVEGPWGMQSQYHCF